MWIWFITVCAAFPIVWYAWNILCGSVSSAGPSHDSFLASSKLSANTGDRNSGTNEESKKKDSLLILYGSQTGTAESYANLLGREAKKMGFTTARIVDACEYNHEAQLAMERAVIFVLATYGEGEPTDSARELHTWLLSEAFGLLDFRNMSYTVFALGDSQYKYFCQTGKDIDARLQVLGAQRFYETGYGDADRDLEEAFESWQGPMWTVLGSIFGITTMYDPDMPTPCNTKLIYEEDAKESPIPYQKMSSMMEPTQKQPAYARLVENSELLQGGNKNRSTRLLVFDLQSTGVSFQAGDHVGILPCNPDPIVDAYAKILGLTDKDLNTVIRLVPTSGISRSILPCRVTPRKALKWYVDLCGIPRKSALRAFAHYCTDPNQKEEFLSYLRPNDEAVTKYHAMQKELGTVHGFLSRFNTCRVPLAHFLELMPRIAPRYYSIASDILEHGKVIHVVAAIIPNGLCSNWLAQLQPSAEQPPIVPLFVRKSTFHLSMRFKTAPVVMIGPGTGVAPFIGFVHRRTAWKNKGHDLGDALLFFGCRSRHEDFICQEVMQNAVKTGVLNELVVAFSREGNKKVYVQHKLQEYEDKVCEALMDNGYLYICGDAKNMARDVESVLIDILIKKTSMSRTKAVEFLSRLEKQDRYLKDVWTC